MPNETQLDELTQKLAATEKLVEELRHTVEDNKNGLMSWDQFQLKEPLDPFTQRILANYGNANVTAASIGLGNVSNTSDATKWAATATLTNKRITKRVGSTASTASLTIDGDSYDLYRVTALAAGMTINTPSGTPTDGQPLLISIKDNGTARGLTWNSVFRAIGTTLPSTTVISKYNVIGCVYNLADTKWDVVMSVQEA